MLLGRLAQLSAFHSVEHDFLVNNPDWEHPFQFEIASLEFYGRNFSHGDLTFCARYALQCTCTNAWLCSEALTHARASRHSTV